EGPRQRVDAGERQEEQGRQQKRNEDRRLTPAPGPARAWVQAAISGHERVLRSASSPQPHNRRAAAGRAAAGRAAAYVSASLGVVLPVSGPQIANPLPSPGARERGWG